MESRMDEEEKIEKGIIKATNATKREERSRETAYTPRLQ